MSSRWQHCVNLFSDRDVLHATAVSLLACTLSGGLLYLAYFTHVLRTARRAPVEASIDAPVLLFGKHAPAGRMDGDFRARIDRAVALWEARPQTRTVLLGGGPADAPTEAALARQALLGHGLPAHGLVQEDASRDTLQNLRNARDVLAPDMPAGGPVLLLSSRYHLARCQWFARRLGFEAHPVAAEPRLRIGLRTLQRVASEAGLLCVADLGHRWARLRGARSTLQRLS